MPADALGGRARARRPRARDRRPTGPATRSCVPGPSWTRLAHDRDGLLCQTGDAAADAYLAGTAPVLAAIIDRMTDRQRQIARLALVDGLRQSEIAERLDVARPTVSVSYARADVRNLARLVDAVRRIWTDGVERVRPMASTRVTPA